jgi:hypothetical protein
MDDTFKPKRDQLLEPGFVVFVVLHEGYGSDSGLVGRVEAVHDLGFRITLHDWIIGRFQGWDVCVLWDNVCELRVATPAHNVRQFVREAGEKWQQQVKSEDE